jgi:FAD/FMN-containing dehydrogenase
MVKVASWGRLAIAEHHMVPLASSERAASLLAGSKPGIVFGNGRSYGDMCLNPSQTLWDSRFLDRFIGFDVATGRLICEPGVLLRDIHHSVVKQGWMLPVTPGTQLITVGGAIANDIHGKNHHVEGTFGEHVIQITLVKTDGQVVEISPESHSDLFAATIGGMGLTGVMTRVELQLKPITTAMLETETLPFADLQTFLALADASELEWEHTVAWVDCTTSHRGRGIFQRARQAKDGQMTTRHGRQLRVPLTPPLSCINRVTLSPLCSGYYALQEKKAGLKTEHFETFLYPLDNLLEWNRVYGPRGFYQHQSVIPRENSEVVLKDILDTIQRQGAGSFLSVLKTFADRPAAGMLSFPRAGVTLAMDFPNRGEKTTALMNALDDIVHQAGGRLYAAKDARMSADFFRQSYPRLEEFLAFRDPGISSAMSRRLLGS